MNDEAPVPNRKWNPDSNGRKLRSAWKARRKKNKRAAQFTEAQQVADMKRVLGLLLACVVAGVIIGVTLVVLFAVLFGVK